MAHANIEARRKRVSEMMSEGKSHGLIKVILSNEFNCSAGAIHADIIHFMNIGRSGPIYTSASMRAKIFERDGKKCRYCQTVDAYEYIIEHVIPAAFGGLAVESNLVVACQSCNIKKGRSVWTPLPENISC